MENLKNKIRQYTETFNVIAEEFRISMRRYDQMYLEGKITAEQWARAEESELTTRNARLRLAVF